MNVRRDCVTASYTQPCCARQSATGARSWPDRKAGTRQVWYEESKPTGGKVTIRRELIERGGSNEVWYEESQPPGGKGPLRPHLIEAGGSSEAWYGLPAEAAAESCPPSLKLWRAAFADA